MAFCVDGYWDPVARCAAHEETGVWFTARFNGCKTRLPQR